MREAAEHDLARRGENAQRPGPSRFGVLPARILVAGCLLGSLALAFADVAAGRSPFLSGGLFALSTALVLLGADRMGLDLPPFEGGSLGIKVNVALIALRSSSWLLFALEERWHPLHLPAAGDASTALQAAAVIAGVLAAPAGRRDPHRIVRLVLDGLVMACAVLLALWVTVIGPRIDFRVDHVPDVIGILLVLLVVAEVTVLVLVLVRDVTTKPVTAFLTLALVAAAEVRLVASGLDGASRTVDAVTLAAWCSGWTLYIYSACYNRGLGVGTGLDERGRRRGDTRATAIATVSSLVCCFVAVLAPGPGALSRMPGGIAAIALGLTLALVFGVREFTLARIRLRLTERLHEHATLDPLTGLANRRALTDLLDGVAADRQDWVFLALDLDGFKAVNDVHGHAAGDRVLVAVAEVLREHCPDGGLAARTGGDEFALLLPGSVGSGQVLGSRVRTAVGARLSTMDLAQRVTVSVGVGRVHAEREPASDGERPDRLAVVVEAAAALRSAKAGGRNRVEVYPGRVARDRERRLIVETRLREALQEGGITAVGQPIVDLRTGEPASYEALARWDDAVLGTVPPEEFVAVAEETGLIGDLGRRVLRCSLEGFLDRGLLDDGARLAINASPVELRHPGYVAGLSKVLQEYGFPPRLLVVEVTEAVAIEDVDPTVNVLHRLVAIGVRVAIDDFGTGYSALGYLRRLPVQTLKVDRSLLAESRTTARTRQILTGVVELARRLELPVTVEGIEDEYGVRLARQFGADKGQGYLIGRPAPWSQVSCSDAAQRLHLGPDTANR